ncbi:MAG: ATP-binding protein [Treponema sp.]|nr:ATP-binding protein [Treponema sp.]
MEITPVTVICGNQATGKSTIAKLYSTFVWLEKALKSEKIQKEELTYDEFANNYLAYHCIKSYLTASSEIDCILDSYEFHISQKTIDTIKREDGRYVKPKIAYIPAERNFCSALPKPNAIAGVLKNLFETIGDFDVAREARDGKKYKLPIGDYYYRYDEGTNRSYISDTKSNYEIELYEAASGIQSVVPLSLISRYYSNFIDYTLNGKRQQFSLDEKKQVETEYKKLENTIGVGVLSALLSAIASGGLSLTFSIAGLISAFSALGLYNSTSRKEVLLNDIETGDERALKQANDELLSIITSRFINIVEEPEQNLYPDSQGKVLFELVECMNTNEHNQLMITTHSPYMLSYLTQCAKAAELLEKGVPSDRIEKIVPVKSAVPGEKISIYETKEDGSIALLKPYENLPSDENLLNIALADGNERFSQLLDLEVAFCK